MFGTVPAGLPPVAVPPGTAHGSFMSHTTRNAVVMAVGPGAIANTLDTIDSLLFYASADTKLFLVDDCTADGTYPALQAIGDPRIVLLRNDRPYGYAGLLATLATGFRACLARGPFATVLKFDTDALMTGPGVFDDVWDFLHLNQHVGICGRHLLNYDGGSKSFRTHTAAMLQRCGFPPRDDRAEGGFGWICAAAMRRGWGLGENIFGGAYFLRYACLAKMAAHGYLDPVTRPANWIAEDVYYTMCAVATGYDRAHFAAPLAPLALAHGCLPTSVAALHADGMKVLHSVDKGRWTTAEENDGMTPRAYFRRVRQEAAASACAALG